MTPGQHVVLVGTELDALGARTAGLQLRDTLLILLPGPRTAFAFLFRQPLEGTVAENVLKYGVGGLNIDGCRVLTGDDTTRTQHAQNNGQSMRDGEWKGGSTGGHSAGRWPSNLVLVHGPGCVRTGEKSVKGSHNTTGVWGKAAPNEVYGTFRGNPQDRRQGFTDENGLESVPNWQCQPDCPVRLLDEQSGDSVSRAGGTSTKALGIMNDDAWVAKDIPRTGHADSGGASRFYPQFKSFHEALDWLTKLVTPQS